MTKSFTNYTYKYKKQTDPVTGEEIPLSARIMAVSDVFDALVSTRSYKKPFTFEEAMKIIVDGSGTHFDPKIVKVFSENADKVKEIADEHKRTIG